MMPLPPKHFDAIVFDFDGVLVESADIKTSAFAALYASYGEAIERQVVTYHLANAGISRYKKFKYFQERLLCMPYTEADGEVLATRFTQLVVEAVLNAPYVPGAAEFLTENIGNIPFFVASGTPEKELQEIVRLRNMDRFFVAVHGSPRTKAEILTNIAKAHAFEPHRVLMVGDAMADYEGAMLAGTAFVGRQAASAHTFPDHVTTIPDLTELQQWV